MKTVVIGSGRVGCGCAAQLLHDAGHEVWMIGRGAMIARLERQRRFRLVLTDGRSSTKRQIEIAGAVDHADAAAARAAIASADLVCTAVGEPALVQVIPLLAAGLADAKHPVDVIGFENIEDAGSILAAGVRRQLGQAAGRHGYSGAVVDRVLAQRILPEAADEPARILGEPGGDVTVDATTLTGNLPPIAHLVPVEDFRAHYRRKLYRYSTGHATTAYLGRLKGYRELHTAIRDAEIRRFVLAAMDEGRIGLAHSYGAGVAGTRRDLESIVRRFENAAIGDTVARVGRDVPRKISRSERLVGAARLAARAGLVPVNLTRVVAAALHSSGDYSPCGDTAELVSSLTGLARRHPLTALIAESWRALARAEAGTIPPLQRPTWAWEAPQPMAVAS